MTITEKFCTNNFSLQFEEFLQMSVFHQGSTPPHTARKTVEFLCPETSHFIETEQWPPNSPDLNPIDYKICAPIQQCICTKDPESQSTEAATDAWHGFQQHVIDAAIDEWRPRFTACKRRYKMRTFWTNLAKLFVTLITSCLAFALSQWNYVVNSLNDQRPTGL